MFFWSVLGFVVMLETEPERYQRQMHLVNAVLYFEQFRLFADLAITPPRVKYFTYNCKNKLFCANCHDTKQVKNQGGTFGLAGGD
jgi:hypothetical protein